MLYQKRIYCRMYWRSIFIIAAIVFTATFLYAQETHEQRSYTAPSAIKAWIFFGTTATSRCEYEENSLTFTKPAQLHVRIRETPLRGNYYDIIRAKMWDQRSIQGYSDSLRLLPQFNYDGYEHYSYSISEEIIDLGTERYKVLITNDYDQAGMLLGNWITDAEKEKVIADASKEKMLAEWFNKKQNLNLVKK
jgi:hypothetical protein